MDDESCECDGEESVPERRWRWMDMGISFMDFAAESAFALAHALAEINNSMRAHYNWQVAQSARRTLLVEHDTISLTGE